MSTDEKKKKKAEALANSRPIDVHVWSSYPEVNKAVDALTGKIIDSGIYKRIKDKEKLKRHLKIIVLDLYIAHLADPELYVAYSRKSKKTPCSDFKTSTRTKKTVSL